MARDLGVSPLLSSNEWFLAITQATMKILQGGLRNVLDAAVHHVGVEHVPLGLGLVCQLLRPCLHGSLIGKNNMPRPEQGQKKGLVSGAN